MVLHGLEQPQKLRIARAVNRGGTQNDMLGAAVVSYFQLAGKLALAVFGDRTRRVHLASRGVTESRSRSGQAGNMDEPLHLTAISIDGANNIARPSVVGLVKPGNPARLSGAGAVNDVRDAQHHLPETFRVADRARVQFDLRQMGCDELRVTGGPEQENGIKASRAEAIENMAANKPARSCEQDLQLDQAELFAYLAQLVQGEINLPVRVRRH